VKKASPPNGVYVVTFIALMLGINSVLGGGPWITNSVRPSSSAFALVGVVSLLVGILDIALGAGFLWARSWSWALGILAALVTGILGALEMNVQSQSLSVGTGLNAVSIAWIIFPLVIVYYLTTNSVKTYLFRKPIGC